MKISAELDGDEGRWYIRVEIAGRPFFFTAPDSADIAEEIKAAIAKVMADAQH